MCVCRYNKTSSVGLYCCLSFCSRPQSLLISVFLLHTYTHTHTHTPAHTHTNTYTRIHAHTHTHIHTHTHAHICMHTNTHTNTHTHTDAHKHLCCTHFAAAVFLQACISRQAFKAKVQYEGTSFPGLLLRSCPIVPLYGAIKGFAAWPLGPSAVGAWQLC